MPTANKKSIIVNELNVVIANKIVGEKAKTIAINRRVFFGVFAYASSITSVITDKQKM